MRLPKPRRLPVAFVLLALLPGWADRRAADPPPNVLLIIADDLTWRDIGAYGNADVHTPHIDRLTREGLRFTHAFQAAPMCSPTRSNLYTGLYPFRNGAYPNHANVRPGVRSIFNDLQALGYRTGLAGKEHVHPPESFPYEHMPELIEPDGPASITEFVRRDREQPFLLVVASREPHSPWDLGDPGRFDPSTLTLPPDFIDTPETRGALARYYAEIAVLDDQVGQLMELLREEGLEETTLVLFTSEQGSMFPRAKWSLYDAGIRTALVARWPGRIAAGSTTSAMVEYTDVVPTLIELAGSEPTRPLDGRSFLPVLLGRADAHKDHVFGIHTTRGISSGTDTYGIRSVRSRDYKYILNLSPDSTFRNNVTELNRGGFWVSWREAARSDPRAEEVVHRFQHRPAVELYYVPADPYEERNLADDPRYRTVRDSLRQVLDAWMADQGDLGQTTELEAYDHQVRPRRR